MSKAIKLLLVEDAEDDAELAVRALRRGGFSVEFVRVQNAAAMKAALAAQKWDAVISDFRMPGFIGMDALEIFKESGLDIPFILVSGHIGEEIAVEAMKAGASDFVMKKSLARLAPALERELQEAANRAAHRVAQRDLIDSERRLRAIFETEPECVKVVSREGVLLEMNAAGLVMLEAKSVAEVRSRTLLEFVVPAHRAAFVALHQRVIHGERGVLEFEVIGLKGGRRWLETHAAPLGGAYGGVVALLGITRDITERKKSDAALRESEARFRSLTELSADWYWEQDEEYRFVNFSGGDQADGWGRDQITTLGLHRWDLPGVVPVSDSWDEHKALLEARQPFRNFEYRRTVEDGRLQYVAASGEPVSGPDGCFAGYRGVATDITERKHAEHELQRFRMAMDMSADSIYLTDLASMRFVYLNNRACERLGYKREQLLQMGPQDVLAVDPEQIRREFEEVVAAGDAGMTLEHRFVRSDGGEGWTELHRCALHTGAGALIVSIGRDITDRKQADERIRRLNRIYAVLSGINALIVRASDRKELFSEACRIACELGGFSITWVGEVDRSVEEVKPVAIHGADMSFFERIRMTIREDAPEGLGVTGETVRNRAPVISNDTLNDPRITAKRTVEGDTRSLAVLPLIVAEQAVAVLVLHSKAAGFFDEEEVTLLRELAADIGLALEHIERARKLDYLAYYDALTDLANRSLFHERLTQYLRTSNQREVKLALVLINVERFQAINDSLGRQAGDELLRQLAARLAGATDRANIARIGGDHFAIILPDVKGRSEVVRTFERIWRDCFGQPFRVNGTDYRISAKAGLALHPTDGTDAEILLANTEAALRNAKETGERHQFHTPTLTKGVAEQLRLENQLRHALEKEQFILHYQPKVDLPTGSIVGVEALIRWQSPELGLVPPMKFIPLLEETGLILEVGTWALRRAAADHRDWVEQGLQAPRVAVNVSAIQLRRRGFVDAVAQAINKGVAPTGIDLEITETLVMEDIEGNIRKLKEIRELGVNLAIDDFGTGYSSLAYLAKLPVQTLKIDRSFIIAMLNDADTMTLVQTIISLAHSMRLRVVAEGVEHEEQAKMLRLLRCDEMQGYLFSRPIPVEQMTALLKQGKQD